MSVFGEPESIGQLIRELKKLDPNEELTERYRRFLRGESTLSRADDLKRQMEARDQKGARKSIKEALDKKRK
jgi:hypothetical protein